MYKQEFSKQIQKEIEVFVKHNYPAPKVKQMYYDTVKNIANETKVTKNLDEYAMPLVEVNKEQISGLNNLHSLMYDEYIVRLQDKLFNWYKSSLREMGDKNIPSENIFRFYDSEQLRKYLDNIQPFDEDVADIERIKSMVNKLDKLDAFKAPQMKAVHETIVDKANQARKCQIAKDNSRMLQIYDRMTHFIKLQQTTVMPGFHVRNKLSNNFNNWLVIGRDVLDRNLQANAFKAMRAKGNSKELKGLTIKIDGVDMKWSDLYYLAKQHDVINEGYFAKDIGVGVKRKVYLRRLLIPNMTQLILKTSLHIRKVQR